MARGKSVRLLASIPERYSPDFMDRLDKRTVLGRAVFDRYYAIVSDLGGDEALSNIRRSLVRRFTWFEIMIEGMECRAAAGEGVDIGSWTQLTNSWLGIARMLGLDRRSKPIETLRDIMRAEEEPDPAAAADATSDDRFVADDSPPTEESAQTRGAEVAL
jgi:hypothetical protein